MYKDVEFKLLQIWEDLLQVWNELDQPILEAIWAQRLLGWLKNVFISNLGEKIQLKTEFQFYLKFCIPL